LEAFEESADRALLSWRITISKLF